MHDNLQDIVRFIGGTMSFTFDNIAYRAQIAKIDYVPIGPGAVKVNLVSLQPVTEGPAVPDIPLDFVFSFFGATITHNAREFVVDYIIIPPDHFDKIISFRMPD
jgi:hypothetical protein